MVKVPKRLFGPYSILEFFASHYLARTFQKCDQQFERLLLQLDPQPRFTQLPGTQVDFEDAEPF